MQAAAGNICIVIPTYNNAGTICDVAGRAVALGYPVIVVNDGSTDQTAALLAQSGLPISVLNHSRNRGKGIALRTALAYARAQGFRYAITLDADGQHFPEDVPVLVEALSQHPGALIVGSRNLQAENMPGGNTFANRFSNFWFRVQTARSGRGSNWCPSPSGSAIQRTGFRVSGLSVTFSVSASSIRCSVCWRSYMDTPGC